MAFPQFFPNDFHKTYTNCESTLLVKCYVGKRPSPLHVSNSKYSQYCNAIQEETADSTNVQKLFQRNYPKCFSIAILMLVIVLRPQTTFLLRKQKFKLLSATMFGLLFLQFKELLTFYIETIDEIFFLLKFIFVIFGTLRSY